MTEIIIALSLTLLMACGSDNNKKNITINVTGPTASVIIGSPASFTVTVTPSNTEFSHAISPASGATCTRSGASISCVASAAGTYTLTVTVTGDTAKFATASFTATNPPVAQLVIPATCQATHTILSSPDVAAGYVGANTIFVAVAANFYGPAQDFIEDFVDQAPNTSVIVCSNSTGQFRPEVENGAYDVFFAADETARNQFDGIVAGYPAFSYAQGVPVFVADRTRSGISDASGLIEVVSGSPLSGATATITADAYDLASDYNVATSLTGATASVGLADSSAPYGQMAHAILNEMESENLPTTLPIWVRDPLFNNIGNTFNGLSEPGTTVQAVFVGKSQICGNIADYTYVEFTNDSFTLDQTVAVTSNKSVALDLYDYIIEEVDNGGWSTFLAANCYKLP